MQQALIDLSIEHGLSQVHNQPTRLDNILDLVFTNNESLVKTSNSIPGISDHAMIVTDTDLLPHIIKQKPRKYYIFSRANWEAIIDEANKLSLLIIENNRLGKSVQELWSTFSDAISAIIDKHVPSKVSKSRKSVHGSTIN